MNCRKVSNLLSAYIDNELPGIELLQIRDHISVCSCCRQDYEDILHMKRMLGRLRIQEPRSSMADHILHTIDLEEELTASRSFAARLGDVSSWLRVTLGSPTFVGACACVGVAAMLVVIHPSQSSNLHVTGVWDHSLPPASEFTSSIQYANPGQFIRPMRVSARSGTSLKPDFLMSQNIMDGSLTTVSYHGGAPDYISR